MTQYQTLTCDRTHHYHHHLHHLNHNNNHKHTNNHNNNNNNNYYYYNNNYYYYYYHYHHHYPFNDADSSHPRIQCGGISQFGEALSRGPYGGHQWESG